MTPDPVRRRDAGLRRISNVTKGALAGGLILTGGLSAVAAHSFSGTATTATTRATTNTTTPSSDDQTFQSPSYSIQSSRGSGRVSSGGS